jgi:hypothetical protein
MYCTGPLTIVSAAHAGRVMMAASAPVITVRLVSRMMVPPLLQRKDSLRLARFNSRLCGPCAVRRIAQVAIPS